MDEDLHDIEKLFFHNLDNYEEHPSKHAWQAVDIELDKSDNPSSNVNLKRLSVLLVLMLSAIFTVYNIKKTETLQILPSNITKATTTPGKIKMNQGANINPGVDNDSTIILKNEMEKSVGPKHEDKDVQIKSLAYLNDNTIETVAKKNAYAKSRSRRNLDSREIMLRQENSL